MKTTKLQTVGQYGSSVAVLKLCFILKGVVPMTLSESKAKLLESFQTGMRTLATLNLTHVCRGVYLAAIFYHQDSLLVTAEDQIPIVEVDDSYSSSLMHDFLWFTKVTSCPSAVIMASCSILSITSA